jgi:hypothetical protein
MSAVSAQLPRGVKGIPKPQNLTTANPVLKFAPTTGYLTADFLSAHPLSPPSAITLQTPA